MSHRLVAEIAFAVLALCGAWASYAHGPNHVHIAVSEDVVDDYNEQDAKSVTKNWVVTVAREIGLEVEVDPWVVSGNSQVLSMIRDHSIDAFIISTNIYSRVAPLVDNTILVDEAYANGGDEYLLLVREASGIRDVRALRGHSLIVRRSWKTSLALPWLETVLASSNLGSSNEFFSFVSQEKNLARTVLPVFFQRVDACLVTRRGFNMMSELNPQLAKTMRVLVASPKLIPGLIGMHKDWSPERKKTFVGNVVNLNNTIAGRQALTLFQNTRMVPASVSLLQPALDLLASYERIKPKSRKL